MRTSFLCLAALAQIVLNAVSAEPITIPLYKRSDDGAIYKAAGKALDNGVVCFLFYIIKSRKSQRKEKDE